MPLVVDASVTLAWCLQDELSEYATRVLNVLAHDTAIVPSLWLVEVTNGLIVAERRGRLSGADVAEVHKILFDLMITFEEFSLDEAFGSIMGLGKTHKLSAYDAAYLHLAMREGLPLATQDQKLLAAATRVGVRVLD